MLISAIRIKATSACQVRILCCHLFEPRLLPYFRRIPIDTSENCFWVPIASYKCNFCSKIIILTLSLRTCVGRSRKHRATSIPKIKYRTNAAAIASYIYYAWCLPKLLIYKMCTSCLATVLFIRTNEKKMKKCCFQIVHCHFPSRVTEMMETWCYSGII